MTDFKRGQVVKVHMGGGWEKGEFVRADRDSWLVQLPKRMVRVYDGRNIKPAQKP
jgi:uncharacterized Fe-S cluster-containing radical SAM superfamily enzyme